MQENILEERFLEWTEGKRPIDARRTVFANIRDIPYAVIPALRNRHDGPTKLLKGNCGSCTPKHFLLGWMFSKLSIPLSYVTFPYRWDQLDVIYPEELARLAHGLPVEYHLACKAQLDGRWVLVDATWDTPLREFGFPVNLDWDGLSDTICAVKPLMTIEHRTPEERDIFVQEKKALWSEDESQRSLYFVKKLNTWLDSLRKC